ncbi:Flp family type IVb pilin [Phenylobacterium sp.]|uniref:Flp family type IVb pilin n=1 Tax=Phenylobacterium sp. TaxID=1871053 RepID=UPI002C34A440|nr:Flp family type IVb pilin [Phenylobacterium sp.]HLZ75451.1 Flp family type IVb pilin [Phenylobacterium sp.]
MSGFVRRFGKDRAGATAIEYALIASLIAVVIVTAVGAMATQIGALFNSVAAAFN